MNWKYRKVCVECGGKITIEYNTDFNLYRAHCRKCGNVGSWEDTRREAYLEFCPRHYCFNESYHRRSQPKLEGMLKSDAKPFSNKRDRRKFRQIFDKEQC